MDNIILGLVLCSIASLVLVLKKVSNKNRERMMKEIEEQEKED